MNKKGIELTINFLVTFILAIVIFGMGMVLLRGMIGNSEDSLDEITQNIDSKIRNLACSSRDRVCISGNEQSTRPGDHIYFAVHINNYLQDATQFTISILPNPTGFQGETPMSPSQIKTSPFPLSSTVLVPAKQQSDEGFAIQVPKQSEPGQYFYKVRVVGNAQGTGPDAVESSYPETVETLIFTIR